MNLTVFLTAFLVFAVVMVAMAVGVIFSNRRIQGSCGGLSAWKDELGRPMCEACASDPEQKKECERELERLRAEAAGQGES